MPLQPDTAEAADLMSPIPNGTYKAVIREAKVDTSKAGNEGLRLKVGVEVNGTERTRTSWVNVSGKGAIGFDQLLRACHMDDLADIYVSKDRVTKPAFDEQTLVGQNVQVVIDQQLYEGQMRDQIKSWLKA